jgi:hypothetical protein
VADVRAAVQLQRLLHFRRRELEAVQLTCHTKTAATVVGAHLDELNTLHDQLADAGLVPPRTGRHEEPVPPYDPIGHLPVPDLTRGT